MTQNERVVFAIVLTIAMMVFVASARRLVRLIRLGAPDDRWTGEVKLRLISMFEYAFGQKRVVSEKFGLNHFFMFWGFLVLFFANAEFVVSGLFPTATLRTLGPLYPLVTLVFDLISLVVLSCVAIALYRRLVTKPEYIDYKSRDAFFILGLVASLMIAFFAYHGAEIATGEMASPFLMPVSQAIAAPVMTAFFGDGVHEAGRVFWWLHALIFLFFLNYLPYSKHMHILTAIPNCYFRAFEPVTTVPREQYSPGNQYGVSRIDQFTWKDLIDFTACTECGRCTANCPAYNTDKALNPRLVVHDGKVNLLKNGEKILAGNTREGLLGLINSSEDVDGSVGKASIWDCTTCGACMANCPVFIEHVPKIVKMRRSLVQNNSDFPEELNVFFENVEQRSNPWGIAPSDRSKWCKDLDLPVLTEDADEKIDTLLFVGCAGAFDARNKKVALSVVTALRAAEVSFGILGADEQCCGDSLRRLGNEFVFENMAKANVEKFQKLGLKRILCYCPHCFTTLKNDYKQYGLDIEVMHHSEFLLELIEQGKLRLKTENGLGNVIFHDSCYLGRYNGIYDQPRKIIEKATGSAPTEMNRVLDKSFCCGAGGGRMWMEEEPEHRINADRVREALTKGPDTIAVSCPYCMTMFEDGIKDENASDKVQVVDIAEIVAARLDS
jgi:Fe-S oxidoreductase